MDTVGYGPQVKNLLARIRAAGYARAALDAAIPEWWEPEVEALPGAIDQLKIMFARRFGLKIRPLLESDTVLLSIPHAVKYKRSAIIESSSNEPFVAFCNALAHDISAAMPERSHSPLANAQIQRDLILESTGAKWLSLGALLLHCWRDLGIAVASIRNSPARVKGFEAASYRLSDRYVVFIAKEVRFHAWAAFILAHEMGHIALGHVHQGEYLFDDKMLGENDAATTTPDDEESSANQYALKLLGGEDLRFVLGPSEGSAHSLAEAALAAGQAEVVDPGHLILRYARGSGNWATAQAALRKLHQPPDAADFINERATSFLDLEDVSDESSAAITSALLNPK